MGGERDARLEKGRGYGSFITEDWNGRDTVGRQSIFIRHLLQNNTEMDFCMSSIDDYVFPRITDKKLKRTNFRDYVLLPKPEPGMFNNPILQAAIIVRAEYFIP